MHFYHRDCKSIIFRIDGIKYPFINGHLITANEKAIAYFRNHIHFGKREDGAIIFESETPIEVLRTTEERQSALSRPRAWKELEVQALYPTDGRLFVCAKDGTKHANLKDLCEHIKSTYGAEYFASMKVMKEKPKVAPFGSPKPPADPVKMEDASLQFAPQIGPYPRKPAVQPQVPVPSIKIQEAVGTPQMDSKAREAKANHK